MNEVFNLSLRTIVLQLSLLVLLCTQLSAADYTITTTATSITLTDISGNNDVLTVSEQGGNIQFQLPGGRTYSLNGAPDSNFPVSISPTGITSLIINTQNGDDVLSIETFPFNFPSLTINGGAGNDDINFNGSITFMANASLDVDLQNDVAVPGTDNIDFIAGTNLTLSGTGSIVMKVSRDIQMNNVDLTTVNGDITLEANQQAVSPTGNFSGIYLLTGSEVKILGTGALSVKGKGGAFGHGIFMTSSSIMSGGSVGLNTFIGKAGPTAQYNGITLTTSAKITSIGGNVSVTGNGTNGTRSRGVQLFNTAMITAGGSGNVTIVGTGGSNNGHNYGVVVESSMITSSGGNVNVTGQGGSGFGNNYGIYMLSQGVVSSGASGLVTVSGTGGPGTSSNNVGILISGFGTSITSAGGDVSVTGQGGGTGSSQSNPGISISAGNIQAGSNGSVNVIGTGGSTSGNSNVGVLMANNGSTITSNGGDVSVTGQGGGTASSTSGYGVSLGNLSLISSGGIGSVVINATSSATSGNSTYGFFMNNDARVTSAGGDIDITGVCASSGRFGYGVFIDDGQIEGVADANITITGTGGTSTSSTNHGVNIDDFNAEIKTNNGDINIMGTGGGSGASGINYGVNLKGGDIIAGMNGNITIVGSGGNSTGFGNSGFIISSNQSLITSSMGDVSITGNGGGSGTSSLNYGAYISGAVSTTGGGNISIAGTGGSGSGVSNNGVALVISLSTNAGGTISVTGTKGGGSALEDIIILGGTVGTATSGNITFTSTSGGTYHTSSTTEVITNGTLLFTSGSKINFEIDFPAAESGFEQLDVVGQVNLQNATPTFENSGYNPVLGQSFIIIDNDGSDAVINTFDGLVEGSTISSFLGSSLAAQVSYIGGDGNDVELTVVQDCNISITSVTPTDEVCPGADDGTLTVVATCGSCGAATDIRYSIDGSDFSNTTGVFTGLADGTYTVTVRDVNDTGCTDVNAVDGIVGAGVDTTDPTVICQSTTVALDGNGMADLFSNITTVTMLLEDDFEAETPGIYSISITNWNITAGNIDAFSHPAPPIEGLVIDLDGTQNGTIVSNNTYNLETGKKYLLSFEQANNGFGNINDNKVELSVGSFKHVFLAPTDDRLTEFKRAVLFSPEEDEVVSIQFKELGTSSAGGSVLDNIVFREVTGDLSIDNGSNDNCGPVTLVADEGCFTCSDLGTVMVTLTAYDEAGLSSSCTAAVTVEDDEAPVITSPINVTVNNDVGVCEATNVALGTPTVTDNCNMSIVATNDAPAAFPVGMTTVTWTADDGNGQTHTDDQIVTVVASDINIQENSTDVAENDDIAFGAQVTGTDTDKTFTIQNTGTGTLNLTGTSLVAISGDSEFTIATQPSASSIAAGGSGLTYVVRYTPTTAGSHSATITIESNDCDAESTYTYTVSASATLACDISITSVTPTNEECDGASDGTITVVAACGSCGAATDIRYSIDGSTFTNTTGVFAGLADATYTVTVRDVNDTGCTDVNSVDGEVGMGQPLPSAPTGFNNTTCETGAVQNASATAPNGSSVVWYDSATGNTISNAPTGTTMGIYTSFAESVDDLTGCVSSSRTEVTLTINEDPAAPTSSGDITECETSPIQTLDANDALSSTTGIAWYENSTGTNVISSPTLNMVGSITYHAEYSNGTCSSLTRTPVTLTITAGTITYYQDLDADGYGNLNVSVTACTQPTGYVDNANDCNDGINSLNTVTTYSYDDVCYLTLYDALDESGGTGIVKIEADATPPEINTIPEAVTVEVLAGACWTNNVLLTNSGIIQLIGTGKFINDTDGIYTGSGNFVGNFQNNGNIRIGN